MFINGISKLSLLGKEDTPSPHRRTGPVSFRGAEVSCPNIFSIACPKIQWFCPNITWYFARIWLFSKFQGGLPPSPPPPPPASYAYAYPARSLRTLVFGPLTYKLCKYGRASERSRNLLFSQKVIYTYQYGLFMVITWHSVIIVCIVNLHHSDSIKVHIIYSSFQKYCLICTSDRAHQAIYFNLSEGIWLYSF